MKHDEDLAPAADDAFDLRARAEFALAYQAGGEPPPLLFRRPVPLLRRAIVRRLLAGLLLGAGGTGAVLAMRPPALVRGVLEHEHHERALRGSYLDPSEMLARIGMAGAKAVPGLPQLMRLCDVDGRPAYHLITYFEKGGMVTLFAFERPVALQDGGGWWNNVHWQVIRLPDGRPIVLVAQKHEALGIAEAALRTPASQAQTP